ncbi:DUF4767 domain-containing protein [Vagococcus lutrae]|uniref:DUF4767 domain-containing protein n=1 Tax=Vagococcus lutrae TaxID=81947 RepID=UPI0014442BED|nr:DUF4767 domain-containing protein [Vagococcus lutrae]NKZ27057.1 DUF4767 domain-containing protein [Vagococcus lutrae]
MKRYIAVLLVVVFTLVGCQQPTSEQTDKQVKTDGKEWYASALAKGKEAIVDEEYDKALASFDLALEYQANDAEATLLKKQVEWYQKGQKLMEEGKEKEAEDVYIDLITSKNGSKTLKKQAEEQLERWGKGERKTTSTTSENSPVWNDNKQKALDEFISEWEQIMDQHYDKAYPNGQTINYYGVNLPGDFGDLSLSVNGQPISISLIGENQSTTYQVVAMYSNIERDYPRSSYWYLFTLKDGVPKILVTAQNQGNEQHTIDFTETQNAALIEGYRNIVQQK